MYEFGINLEVHNLYSIDLNPPINLLNGLSEHTGIELNTIKALTTEGYIPLLITPTVVKDSILATGLRKVYHHGFDN